MPPSAAISGAFRVCFLQYQGIHTGFCCSNQKACLTQEAKKAGAQIMNKVIVNEVLVNAEGRFVGAIGINIREEIPRILIGTDQRIHDFFHNFFKIRTMIFRYIAQEMVIPAAAISNLY